MLNDGRWVQSQDFFHDYFKGIAFIPDANDACISGFQVNDSSMCITVYYHQITETLNEKTLVFNTSSTLTYNKIERTITQTETQGTATEETSSYKHTFYADFGVQYKWAIDRERSFVAGAVYGYSQDFKQDNNLYVSSSSGGDDIEKSLKRYRQCLPQFFGLGASYNTLRWMATIDYKYVDWSRMQSSQSNVSFENQHRLSVGGRYTLGNVYRNPVSILLGTGINNSYIVIQKKKATEYYVSTGLNFGLRNNNVLSLGLKYKGQMKIPNGMQKENCFSLFLNITFSERTYRAKIQ